MHPYEMGVLIRERGHDELVKARGASLYDTVKRLENAGLIEASETSREGRRPERTVYVLTEAGLDEVQDWIRELLARPVREYPQFTAALAFMYGLEKREVIELLRQRVIELEATVAAIAVKSTAAIDTYAVPRLFLIEVEYTRAMLTAEIDWVRDLVEQLLTGDLWPARERVMELIAEHERRKGGEARPRGE